jgi:hypothetical protein
LLELAAIPLRSHVPSDGGGSTHSCSLHGLESVKLWSHFPPFTGASKTVRSRVLTPPPHAAVHSYDHSVHDDMTQSAANSGCALASRARTMLCNACLPASPILARTMRAGAASVISAAARAARDRGRHPILGAVVGNVLDKGLCEPKIRVAHGLRVARTCLVVDVKPRHGLVCTCFPRAGLALVAASAHATCLQRDAGKFAPLRQ